MSSCCRDLNPQLKALLSLVSCMTKHNVKCPFIFFCKEMPLSFSSFSPQFVKTILSQGHLTPLPLYVSPVFWAYDYSLRVYPVPDVIIFADKYDPFSITNTDCLCVNPVRNRRNPSKGYKNYKLYHGLVSMWTCGICH